uniref:Deoxynucleotidyltransferase terminal-interacting protein 1 n=1 Tax=Xiphophorus maculatus TaxID=8083 RepID=A0A3B5PS19_XIPMA
MGAHRSEGGREWLEQVGAEHPDQNPVRIPEEEAKPWNLMIKHRHVQRRGRRSHTAVSYTDPQVSMDLLRAVLQPSFNDDIMAVFRKYQKFFEKAAENVKENVGEDVQTDQLIREACRNVLEHVRSLPVSSHSSLVYLHSPGSVISLPGQTAVSRGGGQKNGVRSHDEVKPKAEPVKREGPKWDPSRLNDSSTFVLGSRANKALGMGGTRGRIYIKHADLFKYAADAKDKQWLAERHHMRATGGKMAYLLIEEDIQHLSQSDEYRDCPDVRMDELKPFGVPPWMVEKMQRAMEAQRDNDP